MRSVVVANSSDSECEKIKNVLSSDYDVHVMASQDQPIDLKDNCDLILLDHNFTDDSGIDFLSDVLSKFHIPVLMVTSPDEPQCAIEAIRLGAYNYLVKTASYYDLLNYSIKEAIGKFNEREEMKRTIMALKTRVTELEKHAEPDDAGRVDDSSGEEKATLIEAITTRFKRGEINLPSYPKINSEFRQLMEQGADISKITDLLKQDVGIYSKLMSISNSPYYCGLTPNRTLEQAISRLGLKTTKNYVEIISNRSLYTTSNKKYKDILKKLWEHSLSCAYASEILSNHMQHKAPDEVFTMGLLHDIGKLLLLQIAIEMDTKGIYGQAIDPSELTGTLDTYHGVFGGSLLKKWNFPPEYAYICQYHNNIEKADNMTKELMIIHLANLIAKSLGYTLNGSEPIDLENAPSTEFLKLPVQEITQIEENVRQLMGNSATIEYQSPK